MAKKRRIRTHAPKIAKNEAKKEESTYHRVKRHHKERAEKQAKMGGGTKKQEFDSVAHLHGALGNKKVTELHRTGKLMAMLKMSKPGDRYEREADQIASQVMNTNPGTVHENSSAKVAPKVDLSKVNKKKGTTTTTQIKNLSGGEKLDGGTKKFFKSRFDGLDLSKVNIHKSRKANKMANSINARAFTYGNNIVFNKGEYKPNTFQGKKLLAHELAHVAQQTGAQPKKFSRKIKMDEPGKKVNAGNITDADRQKALENFGKRHKFKKVEQPQAKTPKKHNNIKAEKPPVTKIDKPPIIKEETASKAIAKSQTKSPAPPMKVSSTQGKVVQGWWGKKKDDDKEKEEEDKDGKKPKGIGGFAWWAFKNLLGLIGIDVDQFTAILSKAGDALGAIIKDPKGFFGNLGKAVKGGINNFVGNFKKHLLNGIAGWLFGQLGDSGLELPSSFNFKGILSIILQVIGLTYNNIRGQIVKGLGKGGEEMMSHAESMFEHLKTAITEGPMALWEQLKEHLSGLKDQFFGMIIDWVKSTVIKQGVMFLISMLNPAGAIVQAVRAIIKIVTFFMERWQQIQDFASSVVDSVSLIAKGDVTAAQNGVENSLAKAMPITISFIAKLVGLGGISKHIKKVIKKIQKPINNAIKKVTGKIAKKIKALPIFKKGKKALKKGKKAVEKGKKKLNDAKESVDKAIDDKGKKMRKNIEDGRADKQKKKEDEAKEKGRKGKNAHEDKEQLKEDDKKKHKKYVAEIVQKLKADKGNNAKSFKEFHASKVKLAKDLEGRYQKKLKRGINIDITIPPLEKDKKDNDVDFKIKIAPNTTTANGSSEFGGGGAQEYQDIVKEVTHDFSTKDGKKYTLYATIEGKRVVVMVKSPAQEVNAFVKAAGYNKGKIDKNVKRLSNNIHQTIKNNAKSKKLNPKETKYEANNILNLMAEYLSEVDKKAGEKPGDRIAKKVIYFNKVNLDSMSFLQGVPDKELNKVIQDYKNQLLGQENGINKMSVATWLANREAFTKGTGDRPPGRHEEGGREQTKKTKEEIAKLGNEYYPEILEKKKKECLEQYIEEKMVDTKSLREMKDRDKAREKAIPKAIKKIEKEADKEAKAKAAEYFEDKAALHDPDQVAGGDYRRLIRMGISTVNSSIGPQWGPGGRAATLEKHVKDEVKKRKLSEEDKKIVLMNLKIKLK